MRRTLPFLLALLLPGCGKTDVVVTVPAGNWAQALPAEGRDIVELQIDATGALSARFGVDTVSNPNQSINYCATITVAKLSIDASGHFEASGSFVGKGAGLTEGPVVPIVQLSGSVTGNTMTLTVTNPSGVWGRFTLTRDAAFIGELICVD